MGLPACGNAAVRAPTIPAVSAVLRSWPPAVAGGTTPLIYKYRIRYYRFDDTPDTRTAHSAASRGARTIPGRTREESPHWPNHAAPGRKRYPGPHDGEARAH